MPDRSSFHEARVRAAELAAYGRSDAWADVVSADDTRGALKVAPRGAQPPQSTPGDERNG
ncbi:hypothetical protein PBI_VELVETEEN_70 [Mycobacterium phage Velveteen]|uniref:hypothetical protein n=1 Tax=Mycobacterium phage Velveteen TaxID=1340821 RepID=UPI00038804EF|nr:hypothetical protein N858_gp070 [Mycobacterium phage Velveteen]AGT12277.1 hypothetical protein PBI_VELVETEEN_70 [Mycobacterium phage Velveteen]QZD98552.1 hypothetical protein SEA_SARMA624_74 [Mycobacterium phage Sarma624]